MLVGKAHDDDEHKTDNCGREPSATIMCSPTTLDDDEHKTDNHGREWSATFMCSPATHDDEHKTDNCGREASATFMCSPTTLADDDVPGFTKSESGTESEKKCQKYVV
ncbi:hypothetical protein BsWGS_11681 [Bradybaena similaris]